MNFHLQGYGIECLVAVYSATHDTRKHHLINRVFGWGETEKLIAMIRERECPAANRLADDLQANLDNDNKYRRAVKNDLNLN